ncbi:virulence factor [Xanthomonas euvesicatoria]|uniref:virulence factor n=1 Tax=Xanthomonas euvesicatoria TaxID=456327 RepID=UPI001930D1A1|nr:virulence factor [Xanthomonas euvesicatoria]
MGRYNPVMHRLAEQAAKESFTQSLPKDASRMYAIAFDLDQKKLQASYHVASYQNAYSDIEKVLRAKGFNRQQGSVYFGGQNVTAVTCVLAAQALSAAYPWFKASVTDIRMLRIEEDNDLSSAL